MHRIRERPQTFLISSLPMSLDRGHRGRGPKREVLDPSSGTRQDRHTRFCLPPKADSARLSESVGAMSGGRFDRLTGWGREFGVTCNLYQTDQRNVVNYITQNKDQTHRDFITVHIANRT